MVAERAPDGFSDIAEVMSRAELEQVAGAYKKLAGMDVEALNTSAPLVPMP